MASTVIKTVFQFRRDTTENWLLNKDVIPAAGEPCFDVDLHTLKIGDGKATYENLTAIGGVDLKIDADGKSVVLEDGLFKLIGFDAAEVGACPRKNAEGNIEWIVPSTETVDGLQSIVAGLQSDVKTLQDIVTPSTEGSVPLLTRLEALETKMDTLVTSLNDDDKVNTLMELFQYVEDHGQDTADMIADIKSLQDLVGTTPVNDQIMAIVNASMATVVKEITVNGTLLDMTDGRVDITIPTFKGSDEIDVAEDGTLSIKSISIDKIVQNEEAVIVMDGGGSV